MEEMNRQGDREARFMGRITAGMTHEIRNVLAVMRESAGLMEDIMSLPDARSFPHRERFCRALAVIQQQVERAVELVGRLNRFAHSMDEIRATVDLGELLEQLSALLARQARNRRVQLKVKVQGEGIRVITDPFALSMLVCCCIEHCLEGLGQEAVLELTALKEAAGALLKIAPSPFKAQTDQKMGLPPELICFSDLADFLGLEIRYQEGECGKSLWLCLGTP
jgi:C4-dicarboxylate-specific signal transduction histidine kinase